MQINFLANIFRMKHINRWSLMYNTQTENLSEHSLECAFLTHFLAVVGNTYFNKNYDADKLASIALFHDVTEIFTGDLPTPIKYYNKEMLQTYKAIEAAASEKLLSQLPSELKEVYTDYFSSQALTTDEVAVIKSADKLCAYIKCIKEINAGNKEFSFAYKTIKEQISKNKSIELNYFLENCIDAFTLSLDELQGGL